MSINQVALIEMLALLKYECCNVDKISKHTGLWPGTIIKYLRLLHRRRLIRIAEWHKHGSCHSPVPYYEWNQDDMKDAPKPKPKTRAEVMQKYRESKKLKANNPLTYCTN